MAIAQLERRLDDAVIVTKLDISKDDLKGARYVALKLGYDISRQSDLDKLAANKKDLEAVRAGGVMIRRLNLDTSKSAGLISEMLDRSTALGVFFYQYALTALSTDDGLRRNWRDLNTAIAHEEGILNKFKADKNFDVKLKPFATFEAYRDAMFKDYADLDAKIRDVFKGDLSDRGLFTKLKVGARNFDQKKGKEQIPASSVVGCFDMLRAKYAMIMNAQDAYLVDEAKNAVTFDISLKPKAIAFDEEAGKVPTVQLKPKAEVALKPDLFDFDKLEQNNDYMVAKNDAKQAGGDAADLLKRIVSG